MRAARPVNLAPELGDLQALARDGRCIVGVPGERRSRNGPERIEIIRKILWVRIHSFMESQTVVRRSRKARLSRTFRAECVNRVTPVDPLQHVAQLRG